MSRSNARKVGRKGGGYYVRKDRTRSGHEGRYYERSKYKKKIIKY